MLCGMTGTERQDPSAQASGASQSTRAISEPLGTKYASLRKSHVAGCQVSAEQAKPPWKANQNRSGYELLSEEATSTTHPSPE